MKKTAMSLRYGRVLLAAALLMGAQMVHAQPKEKLSFRGTPMGVTQSEFKTNNRYFLCRPQPSTIADSVCFADGISLPGDEANYGGAKAKLMMAMFLGDSLYGVSISILAEDTESVISAMRERYGSPEKYEKSVIQNRAGASFDQINATWVLADGKIFITKRAGKVTEGLVELRTDEGMKESIRRTEEQKKTNASRL